MGNFFKKIVKSKILKGNSQNEKMKSKMPNIINDIIKNNLESPPERQETNCNHVEDSHDTCYKHIYRKKTKWELSRLSFNMMGIEIVYSSVTAFISPILLMYGMRREQATYVWAIGPIFGFLFSPILGSLSDRCKFSVGRRRPFIIILATLDVLGLLLIANSNIVGSILGDSRVEVFSYNESHLFSEFNEFADFEVPTSKIENFFWTVVFLIMGTVLVDFSTDTLLNPSRAYVLDVCAVEDHDKVLSMNTVLAGIGGFIGYIIGYINWSETILYDIIGSYMQIMFYLVTGLFVICIIATVTTFKEVPLKDSKSNKAANAEEVHPERQEKQSTLSDYLKSIVSMPYSLKMLCITNLLCWMSHINFYLYLTHFVGSVVFEGDPSAPSSSPEYQNYEQGIRFGCMALSGNSVATIVYSMLARRVIKTFGLKSTYVGTILLDAICLLAMALIKSKFLVIVLSAMSGIIYCTSFTIPYVLVAHYHVKNAFTDNAANQQVRGLGTDLSIVGTCMCAAQFINSLLMGHMTTWFGASFAVIGSSSILSFLAAITASRIVYLES